MTIFIYFIGKKTMKFLFLLLFCFCSSSSIIHSQYSSIGVGHQPLSIFQQNVDTVHVFCNGIDKNFDGICQLDSGDVPATWWQFDAYTKALKGISVMERGYFDFPFRNAITKQNMYCSRTNKIEQYDLSTRQLIDSSIVQLDNPSLKITAITALQNDGKEIALMYSSKKDYVSPGEFTIFSLANKTVLFSTYIGINPQHILAFPESQTLMCAILCEGTFGSNDSKIFFVLKPNSNNPNISIDSIDIGDTGNYLAESNGILLAVMNGSHEITAINLEDRTLIGKFPVGTSGYNGPREAVIDPSGIVFVSTYNSDIRKGLLSNGTLEGILDPKGKPEGIALINGALWVANAYKSGSYDYDSTITIMEQPVGILNNDNNISHISIDEYQNSIQFSLETKQSESFLTCRIIDLQGTTIMENSFEGQYVSSDKMLFTGRIFLKNIMSGIYIAEYTIGNARKTMLFIHRN
jgi:hypothetical protein